MIDQEEVKEGHEYAMDGETVMVFMIHKPGNGESVTLCEKLPAGCENPYPYLRRGTMQMRKFQRAATLTPNAVLSGAATETTTECGASPRPPRTRG